MAKKPHSFQPAGRSHATYINAQRTTVCERDEPEECIHSLTPAQKSCSSLTRGSMYELIVPFGSDGPGKMPTNMTFFHLKRTEQGRFMIVKYMAQTE